MEQRDYKMEFVYMDSYTTLLEGAQKSLKLLEAGQTQEAVAHLEKSIALAQRILERKLDLSFYKFM